VKQNRNQKPDRRKNTDDLVRASTYQRQTAAQSIMKRKNVDAQKKIMMHAPQRLEAH
jgi:hypothetical protein